MFDTIRKIIAEVTGNRTITLDTDFVRDLSLDSFDIANMINLFEQRFHVEIPVREIWALNTVQDVLEYLDRKGIVEDAAG